VDNSGPIRKNRKEKGVIMNKVNIDHFQTNLNFKLPQIKIPVFYTGTTK